MTLGLIVTISTSTVSADPEGEVIVVSKAELNDARDSVRISAYDVEMDKLLS